MVRPSRIIGREVDLIFVASDLLRYPLQWVARGDNVFGWQVGGRLCCVWVVLCGWLTSGNAREDHSQGQRQEAGNEAVEVLVQL